MFKEAERERDRQTVRKTERETKSQKERGTEKQGDRGAQRLKDREAKAKIGGGPQRLSVKEANIFRCRERERETKAPKL